VSALGRHKKNNSTLCLEETVADSFNAGYVVGKVVTVHCVHFHSTQVNEGEVESFIAVHGPDDVFRRY
jgi:hypothetical protein